MARKSRASRATSTRGSPGKTAKVTVSATSAASAWAFGPRTPSPPVCEGRGRRDLAAPSRSRAPGPAARSVGPQAYRARGVRPQSLACRCRRPSRSDLRSGPTASALPTRCSKRGAAGRHTPRCPPAGRPGPRRGPVWGQAPAAIAGRRASAASSSRCRRCGARGLARPAGQLRAGRRPRIGTVWSCRDSSHMGKCLAYPPPRRLWPLSPTLSDPAAARKSSMPGQLARCAVRPRLISSEAAGTSRDGQYDRHRRRRHGRGHHCRLSTLRSRHVAGRNPLRDRRRQPRNRAPG
jgi:hypothetical protein